MARSSGGGSRSGGSRSGGSRSSSSSRSGRSHGGGGAPTVSKVPFSGARTFRYKRRGRYHYLYSKSDLRKYKDQKPRWFLFLFYIPFFLSILGMAGTVFVFPQQPMRQSTYSHSQVIDNDDVFTPDDERALLDTINEFTEATGIVTQVVTIPWDQWYSHNMDFQSFALTQYNLTFQDENCWLLIYSEKDGGLSDWEWEGIQGDNTISTMDPFINRFNSKMQQQLASLNDPIPAQAFMKSFDLAIDIFKNQEFYIDMESLMPFAFMAIFIMCHAYIMIFAGTKKYSYKELEEVDVDNNPIANLTDGVNGIPSDDMVDKKEARMKNIALLLHTTTNDGQKNVKRAIVDCEIDPDGKFAWTGSDLTVKNKTAEIVEDKSSTMSSANINDQSNVNDQSNNLFDYYSPLSNDFDSILKSKTCLFCGKTYEQSVHGCCPHCNAIVSD